IRALMLVRNYEGNHRIFNIGSGCGRSLNEVLSSIEVELGFPITRRYLPGRAADVPKSILDISRAKNVLGWQPQFAFEEGLRRSADWIHAQLTAPHTRRAA